MALSQHNSIKKLSTNRKSEPFLSSMNSLEYFVVLNILMFTAIVLNS